MSQITAKTQMCIIVGDPVDHSLSPAMHNAAYEALHIADQFVFTAAHVKAAGLSTVVAAVRAMGIRGLTCTIPHKVEVMKYIDEIDPIAEKIGAVNTVVNENGLLKGYNTDWIGTIKPLESMISLQHKKVAIIGAGGASRAMAYGVVTKGASLTIFNRTLEKAQQLAQEVGSKVKAQSLDLIPEEIKTYDIIINATNMGMGEQSDETPIPKEYIHSKQIVFDAVYKPYETKLLREAREQGAAVIHGTEMLLHQGTAQFELYTGHQAPTEVMRNVLLEKLRITNYK